MGTDSLIQFSVTFTPELICASKFKINIIHITGITHGMFNFSVYFDFLLQVYWSILYKCTSSQEGGTLFQLHNLINRRNVVKDVRNDMNATEDFFETVGVGLTACNELIIITYRYHSTYSYKLYFGGFGSINMSFA